MPESSSRLAGRAELLHPYDVRPDADLAEQPGGERREPDRAADVGALDPTGEGLDLGRVRRGGDTGSVVLPRQGNEGTAVEELGGVGQLGQGAADGHQAEP